MAIPVSLAEVWAAFWRLSASDRPTYVANIPLPNGDVAVEVLHRPIPFTSVDAYARRFGYEGDGFVEFYALISAMDAEWLTVAAEQRAERGG